jgi:abequosyltransferase
MAAMESKIGMASTTDSSPCSLLTIAIPTFNRARHLATFLNALVPQLAEERRVELVISDNASADDTGEVVRSYINPGISIRYVRSESNLGADRNILQCYEQATGKYVWICGDDDVIEPFGLAKVLSYLDSEEDYDIVCLRARGFNGEYQPRPAPRKQDVLICRSAEDLACQVHVFFTFISGIIVNKQRISKLPHRPFADLLGTNLIQLSWTYTALEHHRRSLIFRTPLVATLVDNTGGYALFNVFGQNLKRITDEWITSDRVKSAICRGTLQSFLPSLLLRSKARTAFLAESPHRILQPEFGKYLHYWVFDFPIISLPPVLATVWYSIVRVANKVDNALGNPLLRFAGFKIG